MGKRYLDVCFLFFMFFFLIFGIIKGERIPVYLLVLQFLLAVSSYLYLRSLVKITPRKVFICTFAFQLLFSMLLKLAFVILTDCEFGPKAADALNYFDYGKRGAGMSFIQFKNFLFTTIWGNIDDYGYLFYLRFFYIIFYVKIVPYLVVFLNSLFIAIGAVSLYKTMRLLSPINNNNASRVTCVFSSFLFFVNTSATGVKEDIFISLIMLAIYNYVRYIKDKKTKSFLLFVLFTFLTVFFRTAITASMVVVFVVGLVSNRRNRKIVVYSFLTALILSPLIISVVCDIVLGIPFEHVLEVARKRNDVNASIGSSNKQIGNYLASFVGPYPTFVDDNVSMFYSFSSLVKMLLNLPVLYAAVKILLNYEYKYYFICFFYLIGIVFTIVSGTGLDMRYQIPYFVAFLILLFYYYNKLTINKFLQYLYVVCSLGLTLLYNVLK